MNHEARAKCLSYFKAQPNEDNIPKYRCKLCLKDITGYPNNLAQHLFSSFHKMQVIKESPELAKWDRNRRSN
jgi:hypothetical protein